MKTINPIIKNYCKLYKLKFVKETETGFWASTTVKVYAAKKSDFKFVPVCKKIITENFIIYPDNDIVTGEIVSKEFAEL